MATVALGLNEAAGPVCALQRRGASGAAAPPAPRVVVATFRLNGGMLIEVIGVMLP